MPSAISCPALVTLVIATSARKITCLIAHEAEAVHCAAGRSCNSLRGSAELIAICLDVQRTLSIQPGLCIYI